MLDARAIREEKGHIATTMRRAVVLSGCGVCAALRNCCSLENIVLHFFTRAIGRRIGRHCPRAAARGLAIYTCHTQKEAIRPFISIDSGLSTLWSERENTRLVATRERETFRARSAREDTLASVVCALALWPLAIAHVEYVGQASERTHASRAHTCESVLCVAQDVRVCVGAV